MNLESLNKILLFGKPRAFSFDEFESQMKYHKIELLKEFSDEVELLVDGKMMTPFEQNLSDELYKTKSVQSISIDTLERELVDVMDTNTLLMSLKLSHDKDRLKSFIQNSMISDKLFFKLIKMYKWNGEDFFENDDNRDVSAAFILRFYENIQRNHNVQFATTGLIHLVAQTKNITLLNAILELEPVKFHHKISSAIAMSPYSDKKLQNRVFKRHDENINYSLSLNKNLDITIAKEFLKDEILGANVAKNILLDEALFRKCSSFFTPLAQNDSLSINMQEELFNKNSFEINKALAQNQNLNAVLLNKLLELKNNEINQNIYENRATSQDILNLVYQDEKNHEALAKNENTPIEILYQLNLDARYEKFVKTNAGFGKHIQSENIGWL